MNANFRGVRISAQDILAAINLFDSQYAHTNDYESWLEKDTYKWAVRHEGKLYPCKHILSQASGIDTTEFSGGKQTNSVFRKLGFEIIAKPYF